MDVTEGVGDGVEEKIQLRLFIFSTDFDATSNSLLLTDFAFGFLSRVFFFLGDDLKNIGTNFLNDRKSPTAEIPNQNPMDDAMSVKH